MLCRMITIIALSINIQHSAIYQYRTQTTCVVSFTDDVKELRDHLESMHCTA